MSTSVTGGNHNITVYGNGTVFAGSGNDTIDVHGNGLIQAGSGNDSITDNANASISVGGGSDTISLIGNGSIHENGFGGHDTINLGFGSDTIWEQGTAAVYGTFGTATISGGQLNVINSNWDTHELMAMSGDATLIGGEYTNQFVSGSGNVVMQGSGKLGPDTFAGGAGGHDTMTGGANANLFAIGSHNHTVITNFVAGQDTLTVEGHSLSYLMQNGDVHTGNDGSTLISLDGGQTTVTLQGVSMHSLVAHK